MPVQVASPWSVSKFHAEGYQPVFDVVRYPHQGICTPEQIAGGFTDRAMAEAIAVELNRRGSPVCGTIGCVRPGIVVTSDWYARSNGISYSCEAHHFPLDGRDSSGYPFRVYITDQRAAR